MRKVRHMTLTAKKKTAYTDFVEKREEKFFMEDLGKVRIILKCTLTK